MQKIILEIDDKLHKKLIEIRKLESEHYRTKIKPLE